MGESRFLLYISEEILRQDIHQVVLAEPVRDLLFVFGIPIILPHRPESRLSGEAAPQLWLLRWRLLQAKAVPGPTFIYLHIRCHGGLFFSQYKVTTG